MFASNLIYMNSYQKLKNQIILLKKDIDNLCNDYNSSESIQIRARNRMYRNLEITIFMGNDEFNKYDGLINYITKNKTT